jgi:hypothetical protein
MYLSAERMALASQTVQETFEQTCVAWQAIPHWDTGDPGQTYVRADDINNPTAAALTLDLENVDFKVTLAQAISPTPDALLAQVMDKTVDLAKKVDDKVLPSVRGKAAAALPVSATPNGQDLLDQLIPARAAVEDGGYRAPSCLLTNTVGLTKLSQLDGGYSVLEALANAANINSIQRAATIDSVAANKNKIRILLLGRRQRIAHGRAAEASAGEEPVDLAVSVLPSLEVTGETSTNEIELTVRIRFATRIKDASGIVAINGA